MPEGNSSRGDTWPLGGILTFLCGCGMDALRSLLLGLSNKAKLMERDSVLTISGKHLSEPILLAIKESNYYLTEVLGGLQITSEKYLINGCFYYGRFLAPARDTAIREVTTR